MSYEEYQEVSYDDFRLGQDAEIQLVSFDKIERVYFMFDCAHFEEDALDIFKDTFDWLYVR